MNRIILGLAALLVVAPASAQEDSRWVKRLIGHKVVCDWMNQCWREPVYQRYYQPHAPDPSRVYGWHAAPRQYSLHYNRNDGRRCEQIVEVLSTEHQDENNARNSATKLWMASVQWRYGGSMMDLENATDILWRCSASNAHDTISGRLAEGVAKLTGKEGQNVRCQLWARPCSGPREPDRGAERRR